MPRIARIVLPGCPHHITQRGNNREAVFLDDEDRRAYLALLKKHAGRHGVAILGYCLMTNHVHLIGVPEEPESLAKALGRAHFDYTIAFHRKHRRSGHLWQNRFYSCALDQPHFWLALRYVERNPLRAHMTRKARTYPWSSAAAHVGGADPSGLLDLEKWERLARDRDWKQTLAGPEEEEIIEAIRASTHTGRPFANKRFIQKHEDEQGIRMRAMPVGRPRKQENGEP